MENQNPLHTICNESALRVVMWLLMASNPLSKQRHKCIKDLILSLFFADAVRKTLDPRIQTLLKTKPDKNVNDAMSDEFIDIIVISKNPPHSSGALHHEWPVLNMLRFFTKILKYVKNDEGVVVVDFFRSWVNAIRDFGLLEVYEVQYLEPFFDQLYEALTKKAL